MITKDNALIDPVTTHVQMALGLGHYRVLQWWANCYGEDRIAEVTCDMNASTADIKYYDEFFEQTWDLQLKTIIHEYIHIVVWPMMEFSDSVMQTARLMDNNDWLKSRSDNLENTVEHLTGVVFGQLFWPAVERCRQEGWPV
jgi:hypothetical protein